MSDSEPNCYLIAPNALTGNEKYKCTYSNCSWGGNPANGLTSHHLKYHGDVPPSSGARFNRPMTPPAPTTEGKFLWTSPATGFQRGNLYSAASTDSLDDGLLGPDLFLGSCQALGDDDLIGAFSYSDDVSYSAMDSYGSMTDAAGRTITFDAPTPANAPFGYQYAPLPINPGSAVMYPGSYQASWNESNIGTLQQNMEYGSIENYGQGPPITYTSERTSLNDPGSEYTTGPSSSRTYYVDDQGQLR
ncbi:hypothetical protein EV421DRAFT_2022818 [Armillaria borealis]|uniref:Uncharacterized protein n=1 Tax=Armillaria borealis TaxID=47425 RepID=A0AA39J292_9AGAR|nr:hypothetical protein EV421DRAFT_2022818 [Armillaria borealis]